MKIFLQLKWVMLLLGCVLFSSCEQYSLDEMEEAAAKNLPAPAKYLALGDSYTSGEGVTATESWPMQLSGLLDKGQFTVGEPLILAQTGWTSADLLKYLRSVNLPNDYGIVSLMIGRNNQALNLNQQQFRAEFRSLVNISIQLAKKDPKNVMVFTIPNWGVTPFAIGKNPVLITDQISQFNQIIHEEAKSAGVAVVDVNDLSLLVVKTPSLLASDNLHYSGAMYAKWAQRALPTASNILAD